MSTIQKLIQGSVRALSLKNGQEPGVFNAMNQRYGIRYSNQRLNTVLNSRDVVICGGCNHGRVHTKTAEGLVTNDTKSHQDCNGLGYRINKRYGRCFRARKRLGEAAWTRKSKSEAGGKKK